MVVVVVVVEDTPMSVATLHRRADTRVVAVASEVVVVVRKEPLTPEKNRGMSSVAGGY